MDIAWIKSPTGRRVLGHWADPRPAWLWSSDGQTLVWRNSAARQLTGRPRRRDAGRRAEATPIRGQVARLIRLGSLNRASLSRMQFLAGDRPVSATCACTPLKLGDGQIGLLVVGVDPVATDAAQAPPMRDPMLESVLPEGTGWLLLAEDGHVATGSPEALARFAPPLERAGLPPVDAEGAGRLELEGARIGFCRLAANPQGASLLLFDATPEAAGDADAAGDTAAEVAAVSVAPGPDKAAAGGGLASLFDRLLGDGTLFTPLGPEEDFAPAAIAPPAVPAAPEASGPVTPFGEAAAEAGETPLPPAAAAGDDGGPAEPSAPAPATPETEAPVRYRVIGRNFVPLAAGAPEHGAAPVAAGEPPEAASPPGESPEAAGTPQASPGAPLVAVDQELVERVSRYNFDELSRILNDRVGNGNGGTGNGSGGSPGEASRALPFNPRPPLPGVPSATPEGALVTLGGETLVLNRLPLGILVFRDQQVLFANRAITEMTGYESVEALRGAGLAAIFPATGEEAQEAGPVNHLVQRDGTLVPVTARLQSVSWQGRPALMLSASMTEVRTGHEAAVRAFAEHLAAARAEGFIETARSGVLTHASADARLILRRGEEQLLGRPVAALAAPGELPALREFFEKPARFAETARPAILVRGAERGVEIMLFAQGQAGVISSYFGFVRRNEGALLPAPGTPGDIDPGLLARLSRGVRRPLNTVIGFSDLIGSAAFGEIENERYIEYARDIKTAGLEIAALVDELDDFARLRDGRYSARPTDIDLRMLLDSSVTRVRGQANAARVLVRSAISERLPRVRADRASLAQAILNLLASAIDQTPQDGSVVLSAQLDEAGNVVVNVRDSAHHVVDLGERFVVFRDGVGRDGEVLTPVRSSVGLALTRALLAVNQARLTVDPAAGAGTLFSLTIPADNVVQVRELPAGPVQ